MTTAPRTRYSLTMETILEQFQKAHALANPIATLYLRVKHSDVEGERIEPTFEIKRCTEERPMHDYKVDQLWDIPISATMSDRELRIYARRWVGQEFPEYAFPYGVDVALDAQSEKARQIGNFLQNVQDLQKAYGLRIHNSDEGLYLSAGDEDTLVSYPILVAEDGSWSVDL